MSHRQARRAATRAAATCIVFAAGALLPAPTRAAAPYTFSPIVDNTGAVAPEGRPVMNDRGDVVFVARSDNRPGVFAWRGGAVTPVYRPAGSAGAGDGNFSDLVLNNAGHLAFVERGAAGERLYKGTLNAGAAEFANTDGRFDAFLTPLYPMQLDASGRLLFEARKDDGNGGIYQGPDPAADVYIDATIPSISPAYLEQIRPDGAVLFRGFSFGAGWVVRSGKPLSDVAFRYATHFHSNFVDPPSHYTENAAGGHAFLGNVPINPASSQYWQGIFRGNDLVADRFADNRGPIDRFISGPNLLDDGTIIYAATLDDGGTGLFSGPNVTADRILRTGDPLFGSTVTGLLVDPWHNAVNSRGEIVFFYRLADGRSGIALAVPDPTAGPIVTLMIISPLLRRRR